jgi:hypothetical protein
MVLLLWVSVQACAIEDAEFARVVALEKTVSEQVGASLTGTKEWNALVAAEPTMALVSLRDMRNISDGTVFLSRLPR